MARARADARRLRFKPFDGPRPAFPRLESHRRLRRGRAQGGKWVTAALFPRPPVAAAMPEEGSVLAVDLAGKFLVAWFGAPPDAASRAPLFVRAYQMNGTPIGSPVRVAEAAGPSSGGSINSERSRSRRSALPSSRAGEITSPAMGVRVAAQLPPLRAERALQLTRHALCKEYLKQRLVRHIAFVGEHPKIFHQRNGKAQGDRLRRRLQAREGPPRGSTPINVVGRVVIRPELPFFVFRFKLRDWLQVLPLGHVRSPFVLARSYPEPR